jgi:hypothetical protein
MLHIKDIEAKAASLNTILAYCNRKRIVVATDVTDIFGNQDINIVIMTQAVIASPRQHVP